MDGVGTHEVIIDSPEHFLEIPDLPAEQVKRIIDTYIARLRVLMQDPRLRYVLLFKNHGKEAGASLLHPHTQIIGVPIVPQEVRTSLDLARAYYERTRRCLFFDVMLAELRHREHIVEQSEAHDFTSLEDAQRWELARTLKRTLKRLTLLLGDIPYDFVSETTPNPTPRPESPSTGRRCDTTTTGASRACRA